KKKKKNPKDQGLSSSLLRSLRSLSRLKLASFKQQTLRTLTPVSALNAHLLRPDIEPDGSLRMADTDTYITDGIGHPKRKRSFLGKAYADGCQAEGKGGAAGACAV
ncbi:hypothetical protein DW784_16860, partial [Parabacteroides merdae]